MHEFNFKDRRLYCENVPVDRIVKEFKTPLYVYSYATFVGHFLKLQKAFKDIDPLICYSVKANSNLSVLKALVDKGAGLDIVSGGELFRALQVGCPPERIVYASVGKTEVEIEAAIKKGILFFNVESLPELENINRIAARLGKCTRVALRINPDVEPRTHHYITTGKLTNKFGIDFQTAGKIILESGRLSHVRIKGIHIHIGSQITIGAPFVEAIRKVIAFIRKLKAAGISIEYLNIGGGLGIIYKNERPQTAQQYADKVLPILKKSGLRIIMEPGRFIIGSAAILVTRVLYVKKTPLKKFVIVDAGMNDLIRPALYSAHHEIVPLTFSPGAKEKVDIVGPICESGDFLAKERVLPAMKEGDLLAVMCAGAYGFSMASNYNSRKRAAEVLVKNKAVKLIRRRENNDDLVRNEFIVET
ncbi:MAG TPA: diaminopimelate decarboxylase [Candidatus Omnitrophota bacterium]|nr:diaminopimelate decarboxylase [Candidatus Omnitrophota bacterium]HRZ15374.1 diaminopimelate decarboxylase [Candidatus Omnitrophota bacterium]